MPAQIKLSYKVLHKYHNELQTALNNSVFGIIHHSAIKHFYKRHGGKIDAMMKELTELNEKYLVYENNILVREEGDKPKTKEGFTFEQYREAGEEFFKKEITLSL